MTGRTRDPDYRDTDYIQPMELDPSGKPVDLYGTAFRVRREVQRNTTR